MELSHLSHDWGVWQKPEHRGTNWRLSHQEEPGIYRGWPGGTLQRNMLCAVFPWVYLDSKVHGANMGPTWGWQDPCGPHVGPMNFVIWVYAYCLWYWLILLISFRITLLVGQSYGYPSTNEVTLKNTGKWFAGISKDDINIKYNHVCIYLGTSCIVLYIHSCHLAWWEKMLSRRHLSTAWNVCNGLCAWHCVLCLMTNYYFPAKMGDDWYNIDVVVGTNLLMARIYPDTSDHRLIHIFDSDLHGVLVDILRHTNIVRRTAHTIVSWAYPKQWLVIHISDLMMIIRFSPNILTVI